MPQPSNLPSGYKQWWARLSDHLGGIYPFYNLESGYHCSLDIGDVVDRRRESGLAVDLDTVGVAGKACLPFLLGDRTLLRNVRRAPWMAQPTRDGNWAPVDLPPHGRARPDPDAFVGRLREALVDEAAFYVEGLDTVGILLSGGMDSRVAAGILRELQQRSGSPSQVVALTWGEEASRDVVYSGWIADRFGWERCHFPLGGENLATNIEIAGLMGAEVSPLHLHAMREVARIEGVDAIIAGSYGDSVGRAEFSGRRLPKLKSILPRAVDQFGILRTTVRDDVMPALMEDAGSDPHLRDVSNTIRRHEIEQELHYMRRMLQASMFVIAKRIPLCQMFTASSVFSLMWALDPAVRDDSWYHRLLSQLPGDLLSIPWARTGRRYGDGSGNCDNYQKMYHSYGRWLRGELRQVVVERVKGDRIRGLGIFSDRGLDNALRVWSKANTRSTNALDELMSWLASLDVFLARYDLQGSIADSPETLKDRLRALKGRAHAETYIAVRERFRE